MTILSGVKLKLYPNKTQKQTIEQTFGNSRFVWNQFRNMQENRYEAMIDDYNSYKKQAKENGDKIINPIYIGDYDMQKMLTELKKEHSWLYLSDATVLQKTLSNLDKAYKNFFKKPNQFEKPKFKSRKHRSQSFTGRSQKQKSGKTDVRVTGNHYVHVPKLGSIKVSKTTRINGQIKEYTITRESFGNYYISFQIEEPNRELLVKTKQLMGGDLGLTHLLTLSNGLKFPKFSPGQTLAFSLKAQSKASKSMNRNSKILTTNELIYLIEKGIFDDDKYDASNLFDFKNHEKRMKKSAKAQRKVANKRHDYLHKLTTKLVETYDVIVLEDLKVKNMLKNRKLAKAISNASWATLIRFLRYKCEWYGKLFILVPPHYTSRVCHQCGWDSGKKPLDIREWTCSHCHETHDRDINAAINILYRGLETHLQSQLILLNEQIKNGYFSTVFFQVASQWIKQTISYFNQALEIA